MGDYGVSYDHEVEYARDAEHEGVEYVKDADHEDWRWMRITDEPADADDAAAVEEAEVQVYCEEVCTTYGEEALCGFEVAFSYDYETGPQQEASTDGAWYGPTHRRAHSSFNDHTGNYLLEDDQSRFSSESSDLKDEHAKAETGKSKTKKEKEKKKKGHGVSRFPGVDSLDTHSDPGCVDGNYARRESIDLVSSWLRDASLEEDAHDSDAPQHGHAPSTRLPPPRRRPPGVDMVARSVSMPKQMDHQCPYETGTYTANVPYKDSQTLPYDLTYGYASVDHNNQFAIYDLSVPYSVPGSGYNRLEEIKPLAGKAYRLMRTGAGRFATVSRTAAVNLKHRSIEFKNLAVPVVKPILNAVIEESKVHLCGDAPLDLRGRGAGGMAKPMLRPGMRPVMRPGMRPVMRPGMRPVMRPGVVASPGVRPVMRPPMQPGMRPTMRPAIVVPSQGAGPPLVSACGRGRPVIRPTAAY